MTNNKGPAIIDLFCGPGGLSTGFEKAGFEIASAIDYSEPAVDTYEHNHDIRPVLADITETDTETILADAEENGYSKEEIKGVIGGPSCKGFSMANMQTRSPDNPKNDLFLHFIRVVKEVDPDFFVLENVPGLLSMGREEGDVKDVILKRFRELGYNVRFKVHKAEQFGAPQARRRVLFVGVKEGTPPFPEPTRTEKGKQRTLGQNNDLKPVVTVGEALLDLPELPAGGGGSTEMEYDQEPHSEYAEKMRKDVGSKLLNHKSTVNQEKTVKRLEHVPQDGNWEDIPEDLMENYSNLSNTHGHIYYRLDTDKPANTVANFRKSMMIHPTQDRLLTIREAARLQSFPDDYKFVSSRISDKQQMVGDAVPVELAKSVGESILNYLTENSIHEAEKAEVNQKTN